jgi:glycosyltransferase involved in cell wall biosynthesis
VYTPSEPAKQDLVRAGLDNVEVWGRGVDTKSFSPGRRSNPLRQAYGVDNGVVLLHVGRLAAEKGIGTILDAFAIAREQLPARAVHLVVAGTGPSEHALRAQAPPQVTFLGLLDRDRSLPRMYASSDVFLFASLTETLGLVVLEAMSSGLPVIATPAGGVADHLRDGVNGLAFPANDAGAMAHAIVALVMNPELRARLGRGARTTAEGLSWEAELDRLDASYRDVLARRAVTVPRRERQAALT